MASFDPMTPGEEIEPCLRCGHEPYGEPTAVCPKCGLREISPRPGCGSEVPRVAYEPDGRDLFKCPSCGMRVRLMLGFKAGAPRTNEAHGAVISLIAASAIFRRDQQPRPRTGYRDTRSRWTKRCE